MKIKVKETGEIIPFANDSLVCGVRNGQEVEFEISEVDVIPEDDDWSAFRREVAKVALLALINFACPGFDDESINLDYWTNYWTKRAVEWADALIKQLKEK